MNILIGNTSVSEQTQYINILFSFIWFLFSSNNPSFQNLVFIQLLMLSAVFNQ